MKYREVRIPEEIVQAIEAHLGELSAGSAEEYVEAVLRERLQAEGLLSAYSSAEKRGIEEKLRDLGYID